MFFTPTAFYKTTGILPCFGHLYNFYAIEGSSSQSITSNDSWAVPSEGDFNTLSVSVGGNGSSLKLVDVTTYWNSFNTNATNSFGFNGVGNGNRNVSADFSQQKIAVAYLSRTSYSPTQSIVMSLISNSNLLTVGGAPSKLNGLPIRLVKNITTLTPGQTGTYVGNDGKIYKTICIGTQEWMSQDLRETLYRGLSPISNVTDKNTWFGLPIGSGAYCIYDNNLNNVAGCTS